MSEGELQSRLDGVVRFLTDSAGHGLGALVSLNETGIEHVVKLCRGEEQWLGRCAACSTAFTIESWATRHTGPMASDVHAECCTACP